MQTAHRLTALSLALLWVAPVAMPAGSVQAFEAKRSPDFPACTIWFNDAGKPLRNKSGREIGQDVPCPGQEVVRETFKVYLGAAHNTLVLRNFTHHFECILVLAPGSATIVVPKVCQRFDG